MIRRRLLPWLALPALLLLAGAVALRHADGSILLRTVTVAGGVPPTSAIAVDARTRRAFVLGGNDTVVMLDSRTGAVLGRIRASTAAIALAVDERTGRVFVVNSFMHAGGAGTVSVLDARSGHLLRTVAVRNVPYAVAVDERAGRVFVLNASAGSDIRGPVSILDAGSGRLLRTVFAGANGAPLIDPHTLAVDTRRGRLFVVTGGLLDNGPGNVLSVLDATTGQIIQSQAISPGGVAVDEQIGRAYLSESGVLEVLDSASGRALIKAQAGPDFGVPLVDARRGRLFLSTPTGITIRDSGSGAILHTVTLSRYSATPLAVDERTGRVLVAVIGAYDPSTYSPTGYGRVSVVDGRSGAVLYTVTVGPGPQAAAIDPATGHAFIVTSGGTAPIAARWAWLPPWLRRWLPFLPAPGPSTRVVPAGVSVIDTRR